MKAKEKKIVERAGEFLLGMLAEKGEKKTLRYIKDIFLKEGK